jgi:hypothetical protein
MRRAREIAQSRRVIGAASLYAKQGDAYLRRLLVIGARNIMQYPKARAKIAGAWIDALSQ